tara:strand:+ start:896 stop:1855 length:960 start_codon:yes stop_codon:yes gene_type:complete
MSKSRKAGEGNLAGYVEYLNNFDRTASGAGSGKDSDRFSALDIRRAHDAAKDFGVNKYKAAKQVLKYADRNKDQTKMGGKAEEALGNLRDMINNRPKNNPDEPNTEPTPTPEATPTPEPTPTNSQQTGNVRGGDSGIVSPISQNNPIGIEGNNNQVNQDNSISQRIDNRDQSDNRRYYGGSNRTFNYQGGSGESGLYDSAVSKATMSGFYDTDDSPAAAARFMDMYIDSNMLGQRDMQKSFDKRKITDFGANDPERMNQLESSLNNSITESRNRSKERNQNLFGRNPFTGNFELPEIPPPVEDKTKEIFEDSMDRIKKI